MGLIYLNFFLFELFEPFEQFEVFKFCKYAAFFNYLTLVQIINLLLILVFLSFYTNSKSISKVSNLSLLVSAINTLVLTTSFNNIQLKRNYYYPYLFVMFIFILSSNFFGTITYSFTVTSSLIVALYLSLSFFCGINYIGITLHGQNFFNLFLPGGTPYLIMWMLCLIEIVSYTSRVVSLSVRLFANMMSGHALLKILIGFSWNSIYSLTLDSFLFCLPLLVTFLVLGLEFLVTFLQAYVFLILISVYLNDVINLH